MTINEHQTWTRWESGSYHGECACGWKGPAQESAAQALVDAHTHQHEEDNE